MSDQRPMTNPSPVHSNVAPSAEATSSPADDVPRGPFDGSTSTPTNGAMTAPRSGAEATAMSAVTSAATLATGANGPTDAGPPPNDPAVSIPATEIDFDAIATDLADVEVALTRLDAGTYWVDEITGEPLPDDLLASRPTARRSAHA